MRAPYYRDEPFAVLLPDELVLHKTSCLKQMMRAYDKVGGNVIAVMDVPKDETNRYGILDVIKDDGTLVEVKVWWKSRIRRSAVHTQH